MDGGAPIQRDHLLSARPIHAIIGEVARQYGLTFAEMVSHRRDRHLAWARQEAYYRCKRECSASFPEIAHVFGKRDHTTILKGAVAYEKRLTATLQGHKALLPNTNPPTPEREIGT